MAEDRRFQLGQPGVDRGMRWTSPSVNKVKFAMCLRLDNEIDGQRGLHVVMRRVAAGGTAGVTQRWNVEPPAPPQYCRSVHPDGCARAFPEWSAVSFFTELIVASVRLVGPLPCPAPITARPRRSGTLNSRRAVPNPEGRVDHPEQRGVGRAAVGRTVAQQPTGGDGPPPSATMLPVGKAASASSESLALKALIERFGVGDIGALRRV